MATQSALETKASRGGTDQSARDRVSGKLRALLVEDEPAHVELVMRALRRAGFEASGDIAEGIHRLSAQALLRCGSGGLQAAELEWNGIGRGHTPGRAGYPRHPGSGALGELTAVECIKQGAADYVLKDHLARLPESARRAMREKRLREENKQAGEELARSNRDLEQFACVASHDLQEPLRMVAAYTQLLAERYQGKLDADADKYIRYAVDGALRMQKLIQDLLAFSRVGRQGMTLENTDCNAVLEAALKNLEVAIQESGVVVKHDQLPVAMADSSLLAHVFQNLIGNAIKFRGSEAPLIRVNAAVRGKEWVFSKADNGIGIAAEDAESVFVIFRRLHARAEYPGNGIGLSICKKIIEQHGGRIWVESKSGHGSTFNFTLPVKVITKGGERTER